MDEKKYLKSEVARANFLKSTHIFQLHESLPSVNTAPHADPSQANPQLTPFLHESQNYTSHPFQLKELEHLDHRGEEKKKNDRSKW